MSIDHALYTIIYYVCSYDGGVLYKEITDREKSKESERRLEQLRITTSRGSIDRRGSENGKGSEACRRTDGEEFRTARTQIRRIVGILMRDRFFPTS